MKKVLKPVFRLLMAAGLLCQAAAQADVLADVQAKKTLVCGVIDIYEPFGYIDPATRAVVGYDVDVCHAIAKALGARAQLRPLSIEARIPALQQGQADILAAGLAYSEQRATQVDYSHGYYVSNTVVVVKNSRGYRRLADLAGKRVSHVKGSITETYLKQAVPTVATVGFEDLPTAFTALVQGRVEGMSQSEEPLSKLLHKLGSQAAQYSVLQPATGQEVWGIGVRRNEAAMLAAVNGALDAMEQSGELQALFDKWLGASTTYQMQRSFKVRPIKN